MVICFYTGMRVYIEKNGETVSVPEVGRAGTSLPIDKHALKLFIQRYERAWIEI